GLTKCVRAPFPCRPSKLRLEVEAHLPPGGTISSFIPKHILQPASRHSKPASLNTLSNPYSSACIFTKNEPGTTMALTVSFTLLSLRLLSVLCKSSQQEFVHEPLFT